MSDNNLPNLPGFQPLPPIPSPPGNTGENPVVQPNGYQPPQQQPNNWEAAQQNPQQPQQQGQQQGWGGQPSHDPSNGPQHPQGPAQHPNGANGHQHPQQGFYPATGATSNPYRTDTQGQAPKANNKTLMIVLISLGSVIVLGIIAFLGIGLLSSSKEETREPVPVLPAEPTEEAPAPDEKEEEKEEENTGSNNSGEELDVNNAIFSVPAETQYGYEGTAYLSLEEDTVWQQADDVVNEDAYSLAIFSAEAENGGTLAFVATVISLKEDADVFDGQNGVYAADFERGFMSTFAPDTALTDFEKETHYVPSHSQTDGDYKATTYYVDRGEGVWAAVTFIHDGKAGMTATFSFTAGSLEDVKALTELVYTPGSPATVYYDSF